MSPLHAATHSFPYSVQMKYGRVCEYSEALGDCPFPQMQSKVRLVYIRSAIGSESSIRRKHTGSQSFASVVEDSPGS